MEDETEYMEITPLWFGVKSYPQPKTPKPFNYGVALARRACASLSLLAFSTLARVCRLFILFKNRSLLARFFLVRFKQIFLPRNINDKQGL
jgi:hypothetical protein